MQGYLAKRFSDNSRYRFQDIQTRTFLNLLGKDNYTKVCEVGCGKGYWSYILAKYNLVKHEICGCDVYNDFQVSEIKAINPGVEVNYKNINSDQFPFDEGTFDLVFSVDVIEHIMNEESFLLEHIRVAKPGAVILIVTPNYWRTDNIVLKAVGKLRFPRKFGEQAYGEAVHLREYTPKRLSQLISSFSPMIESNTLQIVPCWLGVPLTNFGLDKFPKIFARYCHSWFTIFRKKDKYKC